MVSLVEELVLLAIEDDGSVAFTAGAPAFGMALVGACLVELNQLGRIDADLTSIQVLSAEPTGNAALDLVLGEVAAEKDESIEKCVQRLYGRAPEIVRFALASLSGRGILEQRESRFLWVLKSRRYPVKYGREQKEAKLRIVGTLLGEDLPTPHDSVLIGLARAGGLLQGFLSGAEIERLEGQLDKFGGLDLIAKGVESAIRSESVALARAIMVPMC